jgi:hypothetical protein
MLRWLGSQRIRDIAATSTGTEGDALAPSNQVHRSTAQVYHRQKSFVSKYEKALTSSSSSPDHQVIDGNCYVIPSGFCLSGGAEILHRMAASKEDKGPLIRMYHISADRVKERLWRCTEHFPTDEPSVADYDYTLYEEFLAHMHTHHKLGRLRRPPYPF